MSTAGYLQDAKNQQSRLATILTNKGITASATEKYDSLVDKVDQIGGLKGEERTLENFTSVLDKPKQVVQLEYPEGTTRTLNVKLASKNLVTYPYDFTTRTVGGVTYTANEDGTVTANGTATEDSYIRLCSGFPLQLHTQYTISGCPTGGGGTTYTLYMTGSDWCTGENYDNGIPNGGQFIPIKERTGGYDICIVVYSGAVCNNLVFSPQIELGATATAHTPYVSDFSTTAITRYGAAPTDNPQTYTPTATGEVTGITTLYPTTTLLTADSTVFTDISGDVYKTIVPSNGKNGITKVFQPNVTSGIDSNIVPENIKKGITILGITGTYEG